MNHQRKEGGAVLQRADMSKRKVKNIITAYTFLLPNFVGFLLFTLIPIVCSMGLSFMEWDSANPMKFVGLANFAKLLEDETFSISLKNTIYYSVFTVPLTMAAALGLALKPEAEGHQHVQNRIFLPSCSVSGSGGSCMESAVSSNPWPD